MSSEPAKEEGTKEIPERPGERPEQGKPICLGHPARVPSCSTHCHSSSLTFLRAATAGRTAGAADVAATILWTALAPAHTNQQQEKEGSKDNEDHCQPIYSGEKTKGVD